jgi:S1-C subfamily serine protease
MIRWFNALFVVAVAMLIASAAGLARADEKKSDADKQKKEAPKDASDEERGFMGVRYNPESEGTGLLVDSVVEDSGAAKAGIKDGDRVIKINDKEIKSFEDVGEQLRTTKPGQAVNVTVKRGDKEMKFTVTLGKKPKEDG